MAGSSGSTSLSGLKAITDMAWAGDLMAGAWIEEPGGPWEWGTSPFPINWGAPERTREGIRALDGDVALCGYVRRIEPGPHSAVGREVATPMRHAGPGLHGECAVARLCGGLSPVWLGAVR